MTNFNESSDRQPVDFVLFAAAFVGILFSAAGVVIDCIPFTILAAGLLLFALLSFQVRAWLRE